MHIDWLLFPLPHITVLPWYYKQEVDHTPSEANPRTWRNGVKPRYLFQFSIIVLRKTNASRHQFF